MSAAGGEPLLRLRGASFRYPGRAEPALMAADFAVRPGEYVLVAGPTGSGKSTLLKVLAGLLPGSSAGRLDGERHIAAGIRCGVVFQSPDDQIFSNRVFDEIAFGLRNAGVAESLLPARIEKTLEAVGLAGRADADPATLSGGQKQRLVLAAALALEPSVLVLDEPLSQLDPQGARDVRSVLERLRSEQGLALVLAEHRLENGLGEALSRVAAVAGGRVTLDLEVSTPGHRGRIAETLLELGLRVPLAVQAAKLVPEAWAAGVRDEAALLEWARAHTGSQRQGLPVPHEKERASGAVGPVVLEAERVSFAYRQGFALKDLSFSIHARERVALMGANGSGKSTLLALLAGLLAPSEGSIRSSGRRGYTFQNPDAMLIGATALDEAAFGPRHALKLGRVQAEAQARAALQVLGLAERESEAPLALSRGQRLRLAAAAVMSLDPSVLLLDEPTTGQDRVHIERLLAALESSERAVLFSTHDVDLACAWADRVVVLMEGRVVASALPERVFADEALLQKAGLRRPTALALSEKLNMPACRSAAELARMLNAGQREGES